jgi:hypothetical protein
MWFPQHLYSFSKPHDFSLGAISIHKGNEIRKPLVETLIIWHFVFELWSVLAWKNREKKPEKSGSDGDGGGSNNSSNSSNNKLRNVRGE